MILAFETELKSNWKNYVHFGLRSPDIWNKDDFSFDNILWMIIAK